MASCTTALRLLPSSRAVVIANLAKSDGNEIAFFTTRWVLERAMLYLSNIHTANSSTLMYVNIRRDWMLEPLGLQ